MSIFYFLVDFLFFYFFGQLGGPGTSSEQLECDLSRRLVERFEVTEN